MGKDIKGRELGAGFSQRADGRYMKQFQLSGHTKTVYGLTLKECKEKYEDMLVEIKQGRYSDQGKESVDHYFNRYMDYRHKTKAIKESSERNYRIWYGAYLSPLIGKKHLNKLNIEDGKYVQTALMKNKKLCDGTVNDLMDLLSSIMKGAVSDGLIPLNPFAGIRHIKERNKNKVRETIHRALDMREQTLLLTYAAKEWYGTMLEVMLLTGIRQGEARGLHWGDIDYENSMLHIRRTASVDTNGKLIFNTPKTDSSDRDIPLRPDIVDLFQRQKNMMEAVFGDVCGDDDIVFLSLTGKVVSKNVLKQCVDSICKKIRDDGHEFERITPHALRATFATRAIENGMDPQTLKTLLGHTSFAMTMDLYAHVLPSTKQKEMDKIAEGFKVDTVREFLVKELEVEYGTDKEAS